MRFKFISEYKKAFPTYMLCKTLNVSCSGYFSWLKRGPSDQAKKAQQLRPLVMKIQKRYRGSCGSRRMSAELNKLGIKSGRKKAATLMKQANASYTPAKKYRITTDSKHRFNVSPNLLNRKFNVDSPNQVWVSDITYIWTLEGWLYLAVVIDLFNREVVGLSVDRNITTQLIKSALNMARLRCQPKIGLIFHSDRGSQYCSNIFQNLLKLHGIKSSMSRKGDCWDNSVAESFFASLKKERIMRTTYKNRQEAKVDVLDYVYMFYNSNRVHSYLNYKTPMEIDKKQYLEKVA